LLFESSDPPDVILPASAAATMAQRCGAFSAGRFGKEDTGGHP
jgi:hypothetical protein